MVEEKKKGRFRKFLFDNPPDGPHSGMNAVSPSQIENFDVEVNPKRACERKWALTSLHRMRPPENIFTARGHNSHSEVQNYYQKSQPIKTPFLIAGMHLWPSPHPSLRIEQWITMDIPGWPDDRPQAIRIEDRYPIGFGRFVGRPDIQDPRDIQNLRIIDIKTTSDFQWAKKANELRVDPQMVAYGRKLLQEFEHAREIEYQLLVHRTDPKKKPATRPVTLRVLRDENEQAWNGVVNTVNRMRDAAATRQTWRDFPKNPNACEAFGGCEYNGFCHRGEKRSLDWARAVELDFIELLTNEGRRDEKMITDGQKTELAGKIKTGGALVMAECAVIWTLIGETKPGQEILPGLDEAQTKTMIERACKALDFGLKRLDTAKTENVARDPAHVACVQAAVAALEARLSSPNTSEVPTAFIEAAKLPLLAPISGWLSSLSSGTTGESTASPDIAKEPKPSQVVDGDAARAVADAQNHARKMGPEDKAAAAKVMEAAGLPTKTEPKAAEQTRPQLTATQVEAARLAAEQRAKAAKEDEEVAAKWVFVDKMSIVKGAETLAGYDSTGDPYPIIIGSELVAPYIRQANEQLGVKHPGLSDYGHGKCLAATLCLEDLRKAEGFILLLDTRDPVQLQLLHDGMPVFDVVL